MNEKARKYIISMINTQADKFPCLNFKYGYDGSTSTHIVDVESKESSCLLNNDWQSFVYKIVEIFENKFESDSLMFVSFDSIIRVEEEDIIYSVSAKTDTFASGASGAWLTIEGRQEYVYHPKSYVSEGNIRDPSDFLFDFPLPNESALIDIRAGFFIR